MPEPELSLLFVRPLNRLGARYVVSIRSMLAVSGEQIDRAALEGWIHRQGVELQWLSAIS